MPAYDYRCEDCNKKFTVYEKISVHEKEKHECPKCNSTKITRVLEPFYAKTDRKT